MVRRGCIFNLMLIGLTQQARRTCSNSCLSLWEHPRVVSLALRAIHLQVPRRGREGVFPLSVMPEGCDSSPRGGAKLSKVDKYI